MTNLNFRIYSNTFSIKALSTIFIFLLFGKALSQVKSDFVLTPCIGNQVLNSKTTEAEMIKMTGKKNSERVERWYSEGTEKIIGTVFFKDTPQSFFIKWRDTVNFKDPEWLEIHGDKSLWEIDNGIKIGVELKELIKGGLLVPYPTRHGLDVHININRLSEVKTLIKPLEDEMDYFKE
jgi:hypothetical protein